MNKSDIILSLVTKYHFLVEENNGDYKLSLKKGIVSNGCSITITFSVCHSYVNTTYANIKSHTWSYDGYNDENDNNINIRVHIANLLQAVDFITKCL